MTYFEQEWDPRSPEVQRDQVAAFDDMRRHQPVAWSELLGWTFFRHADVVRALLDTDTFSSEVSRHLSVPGGMDPPRHTKYRRLINPYFSPARMAEFEPVCREVTRELLEVLRDREDVEFTSEVTLPFAVAVQSRFLGWPREIESEIARWIRRSQRATREQDRTVLSQVAGEFEEIIHRLLDARVSASHGQDLTVSLMQEQIEDRLLTREELTSILRTWTAGEIGTVSASVGILIHFLRNRRDLREILCSRTQKIEEASDEILRLHGPLVMSRRVTTREVEVGGRVIPAGQRVSLNWISANRDEEAFDDAHEFRFGRDPEKNLLYGIGIHACPGAPMARLEMRVFLEEWLNSGIEWELDPEEAPVNAFFPDSGFSKLPLILHASEPMLRV